MYCIDDAVADQTCPHGNHRDHCPTCVSERGIVMSPYKNKIVRKWWGDDVPYIGMEVEVELPRRTSDLAALRETIAIHGVDPMFIEGQSDGTIDHGIEFVTMPFTFQSYHAGEVKEQMTRFQTALTAIRATGRPTDDPGRETCGTHVHISRKDWTVDGTRMADALINTSGTHINVWAKVFLRTPNSLARWAKIEAIPRFGGPAGPTDLEITRIRIAQYKSQDRYVALNWQTQTVELRAFGGIRSPSDIHISAQFAFALFAFCHSPNADPRLADFVRWMGGYRDFFPAALAHLTSVIDIPTSTIESI